MRREIFVFGSNREGRHGKGCALEAVREHGAKYRQAEGLQGDSYAIITKELRAHKAAVTLAEVRRGVDTFLHFASDHPEMVFKVAPIGCGLAGFEPKDIAPMFEVRPGNVVLPVEFEIVLARI